MPFRQHGSFEKQLLEALTNPIPDPKYQLWQEVRSSANDDNDPVEGTIIGYEYVSVRRAWEQQSRIGWVYTIETADDLGGKDYRYEEDIELNIPPDEIAQETQIDSEERSAA